VDNTFLTKSEENLRAKHLEEPWKGGRGEASASLTSL